MYGTEKLKEGLLIVINFAKALDKRLDDGKLSLVEGLTLIPKLKKLPDLVANAEQIKNEFLDLDAIEREDIVEFVKENLDLENDKVEELIESSLDMVLAIYKVVKCVQGMDETKTEGPPDPPPPDPPGGS